MLTRGNTTIVMAVGNPTEVWDIRIVVVTTTDGVDGIFIATECLGFLERDGVPASVSQNTLQSISCAKCFGAPSQ